MVGKTLGHYEVLEPLGAGGMGEVYRARDTKLDRDVAIKVLPDELARDPERLVRLEREAKLLASLNHPHIATIHALEEEQGARFLVLELVKGESLEQRLTAGPLPVENALEVSKQIAEALEAAHGEGIIHRDLKPANVLVTEHGRAKVLDFGIAKDVAIGAEVAETAKDTDLTLAGTLVGTPAYMSPEQVRGQAADKGADIWAFGCVAYELLTGRSAFGRETTADTLGAIVEVDPDWELLPAATPAPVESLLRRCLQKEVKHRLRDIGDAWIELDEALRERLGQPRQMPRGRTPMEAPPSQGQRPLANVFVALALIAVSVFTTWALTGGDSEPPRVTRFAHPLQSSTLHGVALSPDGSRIVFSTRREDEQLQLFSRGLNQLEAVPLRGTEGGTHPVFSPNGEWVVFSTDNELKRVPITGDELPTTLCRLDGHRGVTWGPNNTIVFAPRNTPGLRGLMQVSADGGQPEPLTSPTPEEGRHAWPQFTPDGNSILFTSGPDSPVSAKRVAVLSLETGRQTILTAGTAASYAASGHLVFGRSGSLWAATFDLDSLTLTGEETPVVDSVQVNTGNAWAAFALARDGTLVYRVAPGALDQPPTTLVWVDLLGNETPTDLPPHRYRHLRISPDGTRAVVSIPDSENLSGLDVWVIDLFRRTLTPITTHAGRDQYPLWSVDGDEIVFESDREGSLGLFRTSVDLRGEAERMLILENTNLLAPGAWTPDRQEIVFSYRHAARGYAHDLGLLSSETDNLWQSLVQSPASEFSPTVSPDGAWIAYVSDETGRSEVYVERFPDLDRRQPVSSAGGLDPRWHPEGNALFYRDLAGDVWAIPVGTDPNAPFGAAEILFDGAKYRSLSRDYDVSPDGTRFLMVARPGPAPIAPISVVLNWFEELKERVPTGR